MENKSETVAFFKDEIAVKSELEEQRKKLEEQKRIRFLALKEKLLEPLEKDKACIRRTLFLNETYVGPFIRYSQETDAKEIIYEWFEKNGLEREVDVFIFARKQTFFERKLFFSKKKPFMCCFFN